MPRKIPTVDDSRTMRAMVFPMLKGAGFEVLEAQGGMKALVVLAPALADLIVTDTNMPKSGDDRTAGGKAAGVTELTP